MDIIQKTENIIKYFLNTEVSNYLSADYTNKVSYFSDKLFFNLLGRSYNQYKSYIENFNEVDNISTNTHIKYFNKNNTWYLFILDIIDGDYRLTVISTNTEDNINGVLPYNKNSYKFQHLYDISFNEQSWYKYSNHINQNKEFITSNELPLENTPVLNKSELYNALKYHILTYITYNNDDVKAEVFEQLYSYALNDININHIYDNGSHRQGTDIIINDINISLKTFKLGYNRKSEHKITKMSSHRLTSYSDLPKKIEHIKKINKSISYYGYLTREKKGNEILFKYYEIPELSIDNKKWITTNTKSGNIIHTTECDNNGIINKATISESMSSQLWYELNISSIDKYQKFNISIDENKIGKKRHVYKPQ